MIKLTYWPLIVDFSAVYSELIQICQMHSISILHSEGCFVLCDCMRMLTAGHTLAAWAA